jgi:MFS family permease
MPDPGITGGVHGPRHIRAAVTIVIAPLTTILGFLPVFSIGVLAPFLAASEGIDPRLAGAASAALFLATSVASSQVGRLVDRVGPEAALLMMLLSSAAAWGLLAGAEGPIRAVAGAVLAGVGVAFAMPTATALCFATLRERTLPLAVGLTHAGTQMGAVLAGTVLPLLVVALGWRDALRALMVTCLLAALGSVVALMTRSGRTRDISVSPPRVSALLRASSEMRRLVGFVLLVNGVTNAVVVYLPTYAYQQVGLAPRTAALTTSVMGVASVVGKLLWGFARDADNGRTWLIGLVASSVLAMSLLVVSPWAPGAVLWIAVALFGLTQTTWAVPTSRISVHLSAPGLSGTATSVVMMAGFLGGAMGPLGFLVLIGGPGFTAALLLGGAVLASSTRSLPRTGPDRT